MSEYEAVEAVTEKFRVTVDDHVSARVFGEPVSIIRYVEAEAGTGYRYAVTVARLPEAGERREGGPYLVALTSPWSAAYAFQGAEQGYLSPAYVATHLNGDRERSEEHIAAVTLLVRHALDRPETGDPL